MKFIYFIEIILSTPFIIIGWIASIIRFGFDVGYSSFALGDMKSKSTASLLKKINEQAKEIEMLRSKIKG